MLRDVARPLIAGDLPIQAAIPGFPGPAATSVVYAAEVNGVVYLVLGKDGWIGAIEEMEVLGYGDPGQEGEGKGYREDEGVHEGDGGRFGFEVPGLLAIKIVRRPSILRHNKDEMLPYVHENKAEVLSPSFAKSSVPVL